MHGWLVLRSAGSLGIADLVALRWGNSPVLVSCKTNGQIALPERLGLANTAREVGARPLLAYRTKRGHVDFDLVRIDGTRVLIDQIHVPRKNTKSSKGDDNDE